MTDAVIYLDNAATSHPKAPGVAEAMGRFLSEVDANPGRSGHRLSAAASRILFECREAVAGLLGVSDSGRIVFTPNTTAALNIALQGMLRDGGHVVTTSMEHNSVMRPLTALGERSGVEITVVDADPAGRTAPAAIARALRPETRLVAVNHASNVVGTIAPVRAVKDAIGNVPLLVDAAQTAGAVPIDAEGYGIDLLAFSGHKSLLGPQGTGGLYVSPGIELPPLMHGGTGSRSESHSHPDFLPDMLESGTPNTVGIAGLLAGVRYLAERGVADVRRHETELVRRLLDGLGTIRGVTVYGICQPAEMTAAVSITVEGVATDKLCMRLDREHGIMVRGGLHCAPSAHRTIGTFPDGAARLSPGPFTTADEIGRALSAVGEIAAGTGRARAAGGAR